MNMLEVYDNLGRMLYVGNPGADGATGATGATGPAGADGADGADGAPGSIWYSGSGAPGGGLGIDGDYYLRLSNGDVYGPKAAGSWGSPVTNLTGATGATGATGPIGATGATGPAGADGADGAPGSVWRDGSGAPSNALGIDGDYYLDDATGNVYLRASGTYSIVANIKGATGATGATGPQGDPGADGADGADGAAGPNTVTTSTTTNLTGVLMGDGANVSSVSAVSATEVGYLDGVTSAIQTQINGKAASSHTHTLADVTDVTASAAEVNILDGATLSTAELNYVDGVTSAIQTQLDGKAASSHTHTLAAITDVTASAAELNTLDGITASTAELNYTDGVTSAIQTQLDGMVRKSGRSGSQTIYLSTTDNVGGDIYSSSGDTDASLLIIGSGDIDMQSNALAGGPRIRVYSGGAVIYYDGATPSLVVTTGNLVGIGTGSPASKLELQETKTLASATADGYAGALTLDPGYTGAFAVTRHNYLNCEQPSVASGASVTDACLARFDAAAGTHLAVDDDSGTDVDAWVKININGTIHYLPALAAPADLTGGGGGMSHPQVMARGVFSGPF